jgi:SAM-dependent methyltransferase
MTMRPQIDEGELYGVTLHEILASNGYHRDPDAGIWVRPGYASIQYSDGDSVETRIASAISGATDRSLFSPELAGEINDWPSLYHLSATRANILRPFGRELKRADVLEVGAGFGAITRYLGESGANVVALEGTLRRASTARVRTGDLANVEVVSDNFNGFNPGRKFDFVTLIGVLEYANLFMGGENPGLRMLELGRQFLKPDGRLIIAIENQLGLKYFAGALEDHIGQSAYGIEGRYGRTQPQTYGRRKLIDLIKKAGFAGADVMAPFPDYKFPASIITRSGFECEGFNAAALASESANLDPQYAGHLTFSQELAWPVVVDNSIALDLSNSFLVVAPNSVPREIDPSILAYHYATTRSRKYCKEAEFLRTPEGKIEVHYARVESERLSPDGGNVEFSLPDKCDYVFGTPLSLELTEIIIRDGWSAEELGAFIRKYVLIVASVANEDGIVVNGDDPAARLPGRYFDLIPRNIILREDGSFEAIDQEWILKGDLTLGVLVFRALRELLNSRLRFGRTAGEFKPTRTGFVLAAFLAAGFSISEAEVDSYVALEIAVQSDVAGRPMKREEIWAGDSPIVFKPLLEVFKETKDKYQKSKEKLAVRSEELKTTREQLRRYERSPRGKITRLWRKLLAV